MTAKRDACLRIFEPRVGVLAGAVLVAVVLVASAAPARSAAAEPDVGAFVGDVLALRTAGVSGEAAGVLAEMPGAGRVGGEARLGVLWAPFFDNAIVKLGRLQSPAPVALFYNPLLDVGLLTLRQRRAVAPTRPSASLISSAAHSGAGPCEQRAEKRSDDAPRIHPRPGHDSPRSQGKTRLRCKSKLSQYVNSASPAPSA